MRGRRSYGRLLVLEKDVDKGDDVAVRNRAECGNGYLPVSVCRVKHRYLVGSPGAGSQGAVEACSGPLAISGRIAAVEGRAHNVCGAHPTLNKTEHVWVGHVGGG